MESGGQSSHRVGAKLPVSISFVSVIAVQDWRRTRATVVPKCTE
jgi:hypothetical protein